MNQFVPPRRHAIRNITTKQSPLLPMRPPLHNKRRKHRILPSQKKHRRKTLLPKLRQSMLHLHRSHRQKTPIPLPPRSHRNVNSDSRLQLPLPILRQLDDKPRNNNHRPKLSTPRSREISKRQPLPRNKLHIHRTHNILRIRL